MPEVGSRRRDPPEDGQAEAHYRQAVAIAEELMRVPSPRQARWLLLRASDALTSEEQACRTALLAAFLSAALGPRVVTPYLYTATTRSALAYGLLEALNGQ